MEIPTDRTSTDIDDKRVEGTGAVGTLLAVQVLFGSLPVIGKHVLAVLPSLSLVGLRIAITAIVLTVVQLSRGDLRPRRVGDYWRLAALSLFGVTLNQIFFIGGLSLTRAANTSLLVVTIPIFTAAFSSASRTERLTRSRIIGIALAALGVLILVDPRNADFNSATTVGDILIVLNSLCYSVYVATSQDTIRRNGAVRSTAWMFIFAAIICVPLGAFALSSTEVSSIEPTVWLLVLYIGIGATAAPYLLNAYALARVRPSTVAVFIYLQPVIGFILAAVILGETLDLKFAVSAILIFAGVFLSSQSLRHKHQR